MAAVTMYIDKFGKAVTIDEHHPLAVAQRERAQRQQSLTADVPASSDAPEPPAPAKPASRRKVR